MTEKVNGFVGTPDQFLSGGMNMYTVTVTGLDLTAAPANGTSDLDMLIQAISTRAQPVIMGTPTATVLRFAVEHNEIFGDLTAFAAEVRAASGATTVAIAPFAF